MGRDGRFYLIDLARLMPSEGMDKTRNVFAHCLRAEFVSQCSPKLCPDAFSKFTRRLVEFNAKEYEMNHNRQVRNHLVVKDCAKLTRSAENIGSESLPETPKPSPFEECCNLRKSLTITPVKVEKTSRNRVHTNIASIKTILDHMHKRGLNYRHMGYVAKSLLAEAETLGDPLTAIRLVKYSDLLAYEGAARTIKHLLWGELRAVAKDSPVASPTKMKAAAFEYLNIYSRDIKPWGDLLSEIEKRFPHLPVNLTKLRLNWTTCLNRISQLSGVVLSKRVLKPGAESHVDMALSDVIAIEPRSSTVLDIAFEERGDTDHETPMVSPRERTSVIVIDSDSCIMSDDYGKSEENE